MSKIYLPNIHELIANFKEVRMTTWSRQKQYQSIGFVLIMSDENESPHENEIFKGSPILIFGEDPDGISYYLLDEDESNDTYGVFFDAIIHTPELFQVIETKDVFINEEKTEKYTLSKVQEGAIWSERVGGKQCYRCLHNGKIIKIPYSFVLTALKVKSESES